MHHWSAVHAPDDEACPANTQPGPSSCSRAGWPDSRRGCAHRCHVMRSAEQCCVAKAAAKLCGCCVGSGRAAAAASHCSSSSLDDRKPSSLSSSSAPCCPSSSILSLPSSLALLLGGRLGLAYRCTYSAGGAAHTQHPHGHMRERQQVRTGVAPTRPSAGVHACCARPAHMARANSPLGVRSHL